MYFLGFHGCSAWNLSKDNKAEFSGLIHSDEPIVRVFAYKAHTYAISADGGIFELSGLALKKVFPLTVISIPTTQTTEPTVATTDDFRDLGIWVQKVDFDTRQKIFSEANAKTDLTPRQRLKWTIESIKEEVAKQKSK